MNIKSHHVTSFFVFCVLYADFIFLQTEFELVLAYSLSQKYLHKTNKRQKQDFKSFRKYAHKHVKRMEKKNAKTVVVIVFVLNLHTRY